MDFITGSALTTSVAIDKLVSLLITTGEDTKLLKAIELSEVQELRTILELLDSILKDAYVKSQKAVPVSSWLEQIKEVTDLIDNVVDGYMLKVSQRLQQRPLIRRTTPNSSTRRNLSFDVENVRALLIKIQETGWRYYSWEYGFSSRSKNFQRYQPRSVFPLIQELIVGVDCAENELVRRLTEGETRRSVISLVGCGGIGKTTLAKMVYHNEVVRKHFNCRAWITINRTYSMKEILKVMLIKEIGIEGKQFEEIELMKRQELIGILRQSLRSKRYVVVFDDVWREEFWNVMRDALPDDDNGSRVIITSRSDIVVASCVESLFDHVHRLEPLSEETSWDLFCRIAFQYDPERRCPPELEKISFEIIRICEGLPLAIVAMAGLMLTKDKEALEWQKLLENFYSQLESNPHLGNVCQILALSFDDLPYQLKPCFLYFSIFPKDALIPNDKLFKLWIAEGYIQEKGGKTLEEVAEEYMNELVRRNLVQACEGFYCLEKFCRVHSLMHDIARKKAEEFSFCQFLEDVNSSSRGKVRRLLLSDIVVENALEISEDSRLRSVFLRNIAALSNSSLVTLFGKYKLLTLLDFENTPLERLPNEVGNLIYLKYLSLKNTQVKRLPRSVGKLCNLQTLDIRNTLLIELPMEINKLENLRHLLASGHDKKVRLDSTRGVRIKEGIGFLENLQTLMTVEAHHSGIVPIKELQKLRRLRRLGISSLTPEYTSALCSCLEKMSKLESLSVYSMNNYEILNLQTISSPPLLLERLILKGRLQTLPSWISSLQNLSMLCLSLSRLIDEPLRYFCSLPNLVSLWLYQAYDGDKLHFEEGAFKKLKLLVLRELHGLKVLEIDEGALPLLEELRIGPSPLLKEVPFGIQHLRNLKVLANYSMPSEFVLSMQPDGGSDYRKVEHVPSVLFWYRVQERSYISYKLGEPALMEHLQGLATIVDVFPQYDHRWSFCYSDAEEDVASVSTSTAIGPWNDCRMSFSSDRFSFFSDDIED